METSTITPDSTGDLEVAAVTTVGDARRLVAAALVAFADQHEQRLAMEDDSVARDCALARTMAANVTGWTHTTRVRDFLESPATVEDVTAHVDALATARTTSTKENLGRYERFLKVLTIVSAAGDGEYRESDECRFYSDLVIALTSGVAGEAPVLSDEQLLSVAVRLATSAGVDLPDELTAGVEL